MKVKELLKLISFKEGVIKRQTYLIANKIVQIKHFRTRLKKIRNQIDYLLEHPYSVDNNMSNRKHSRDNPKRKWEVGKKPTK